MHCAYKWSLNEIRTVFGLVAKPKFHRSLELADRSSSCTATVMVEFFSEIKNITIAAVDISNIGRFGVDSCISSQIKEYYASHVQHITWPSAFALSAVLSSCAVAHAHDFSFLSVYQKAVLEIGSGTGLVGVTAAHLGARRVVLTDRNADECGNESCLFNLKEAVELNGRLTSVCEVVSPLSAFEIGVLSFPRADGTGLE